MAKSIFRRGLSGRLGSASALYKRNKYNSAQLVADDFFEPASASNTYTLTCQSGSYSVAGVSATLRRNRNLTASAGSYSLAGQSASILKHRNLSASAGSYSIVGQTAGITWQAAASVYTLNCLSGSYSISGQSANILRSRKLVANAGAYNLTGQSAVISRNRSLTANAGSYSVSGQSATISRNRVLTASRGSYSMIGQPADIIWHVPSVVWPSPNSVLAGIPYGPTGTEYVGTLELPAAMQLNISSGKFVKRLNTKLVYDV